MSCSSQISDNTNNNNNNNNYIPSFYGDMPSLPRQQLNENASRIRTFGAPHNFTFSYPTQGTTVPTPRPCIQTTCSMPFVAALGPGLGTTWQHSNPSSVVTNSGNLMSSVYTGMPARSEPQPSCSSPIKRPKRKAVDYSEDAPSSKVYLCTDQFANLNLNNDTTQHEVKGHDPAGWGRFQAVENSIECDGEEDNKEGNTEGVLHINDAITDAISSQSLSKNILPRDVLKEISKPCMQVILWKSPGELVRDLVREDSSCTPPSSPSPSVTHSMSSPLKLSSNTFEESSSFMSSSNCHSSSLSASSKQPWLQQDISNSQLPIGHYSSSQQVPIQTSTLPQSEWNMLSSLPSSSSSSSSLLSSQSKSSAVTMSPEIVNSWDDHIDLNSVGNYDEEMQL